MTSSKGVEYEMIFSDGVRCLLNENSTQANVGAFESKVNEMMSTIFTNRQMLKNATETPCFNRATSSALPLDFELHILKDGQRSNRKKIIGPAAIAKMHVHIITRTESQMTYPL